MTFLVRFSYCLCISDRSRHDVYTRTTLAEATGVAWTPKSPLMPEGRSGVRTTSAEPVAAAEGQKSVHVRRNHFQGKLVDSLDLR